MAIQVFQEHAKKPSFMHKLGQGLEAGGKEYLQHLQNQEQQQQTVDAVKRLTGQDISGLPQELQKEFVSKLMQGQNDISKQKSKYDAQLGLIKQLGLGDEFGSDNQENTPSREDFPSVNPETGEITVGIKSLIPDKKIQKMAIVNPQLASLMQKQNERMISEQQHAENIRQKELEASEKLDYQSFKDNDKYVEKVLSGYEGYKREKSVLDQMEKIANKGNMPTPLLVQALGKVGLPLGLLENPDAEQFEKLSQELMKGIQGTYGSRILQSEVQNFMKSIPTLLNSPEGQKRLIQQWKILNEGKKIYYDSYKDLRKDYPKRLPADLHEKVLEKADEKLDRLANKFGLLADIPSDYVKTPGKFLILSPEGEMGEVEASELESAIKAGYEFLE